MYQRLVDFTEDTWKDHLGLFTCKEFIKTIPVVDAIMLNYADKNSYDIYKLFIEKLQRKRVKDNITNARSIKAEKDVKFEKLPVKDSIAKRSFYKNQQQNQSTQNDHAA